MVNRVLNTSLELIFVIKVRNCVQISLLILTEINRITFLTASGETKVN